MRRLRIGNIDYVFDSDTGICGLESFQTVGKTIMMGCKGFEVYFS